MNGELNSFEEEAMSLSRKDKETINKNIMRIAKIINELDGQVFDPRALDALEIAGSLLEQQVEMDIVFEEVPNEDGINFIDNESVESDEARVFKIQETPDDENTPSAEDLENWFNGG